MEITTSSDDAMIPITVQEEKELRRVFENLSDYSKRKRNAAEIDDLKQLQMSALLKSAFSGTSDATLQASQENAVSEKRIDELTKELAYCDLRTDKKISCSDIFEKLKILGQKIGRKEVEEMVWEVDEDLDQCLNWSEFKLMFTRNISDKSGLEPSRMFNLTQFCIYDHNNNGLVSVDETMNMLYARYGRFKMETKLKELFGDDMHETGRQGGEITFPKYLAAVEKVQMNTFWGTTKGRIAAKTASANK